MLQDKRLVADFLASKGLRVEEFSKEEKASSKTPDFKVFHGQDFAFFCEVKSMSHDEWLSQQLERAEPGFIAGGPRPDPTYNRVSQKIYDAVNQFDAVNPHLAFPNVLVLVNRDGDSDVDDLQFVYTGGVHTDSGRWIPMFQKFSEGRIKERRFRVHLFIWIDDFKDEPKHFLFHNLNSQEHLDLLCSCFGHKPEVIRASVG